MSVTNINVEELKEMITAGNVEVVDVREAYEHKDHHIKGDKLIPMSLVLLKIDEIDWSKRVVLYCMTGARSRMMANMLSDKGKEIYNLAPGVIRWHMSGDKEFIAG